MPLDSLEDSRKQVSIQRESHLAQSVRMQGTVKGLAIVSEAQGNEEV